MPSPAFASTPLPIHLTDKFFIEYSELRMWHRTLLRTLAAVPVGIGMKLHASDRDAIKDHADGCNPVCMLQAKSKKDKKDEETKEKRVRKMESRFESFATIQVDGQE